MAVLLRDIKKAAILVENGFSEADYQDAALALEKEGWFIRIISPAGQFVRSWIGDGWGQTYAVCANVQEINGANHDLLVIPGGRLSVEKLKICSDTAQALARFVAARRPVIVYNRAAEILLEPGAPSLTGATLSAPADLSDRITAAGGSCSNAPATVNGGLLSLRSEKPNFSREIRTFIRKLDVYEGMGESERANPRSAGHHKAA